MLRYLMAGESHGPELLGIIEGLPAGLPLSPADLAPDLARRQAGYGRGARQRLEADAAEILAGVAGGITTGAPLALRIANRARPELGDPARPPRSTPQPGHAELSGALKYGFANVEWVAERASARETAMRVALGSVAKALLATLGIEVLGQVVAIGDVTAGEVGAVREPPLPWAERVALADASPVRCVDREATLAMIARIDAARAAGDTLGGIVQVTAVGLPVGLGSYVHPDRRLDARLGAALLAIPAIKGVEIGPAFSNSRLPGTQVHDPIHLVAGRLVRPTNRAGGLEGGMTTGQPLVVRAAMKPIPTTRQPQPSADLASGREAETVYRRADTCAVPAASVIAAAAVAWVLAEAVLERCGGDRIEQVVQRLDALRQAPPPWQANPCRGGSGTAPEPAGAPTNPCRGGSGTAPNLVLTGFMGTGKSAVGRAVASALGRPFVDMDAALEARLGTTIAACFATAGEAAFRRAEAELLQELAGRRGLVIATGGGALVPEANRRLMLERSTVIRLTCALPQLRRRLAGSTHRPLLQGGPQAVARLLERRRAAYGAIPLRLDTTHLSVDEAAAHVLRLAPAAASAPCQALALPGQAGGYDVAIGEGLLARAGALLKAASVGPQVVVISEPRVRALHGAALAAALAEAGVGAHWLEAPSGEAAKTYAALQALYDGLLACGADRHTAVIALGGGALTDAAGFAAATWMRGLPWVTVPSTLLAQVDAGLGGKVAIDHPQGKNLVGAFHPPRLVLVDPALLGTLPPEEMRAGLAEVVKHGVIADPALFARLEAQGPEPLAETVARAVRVKVDIVAEDPEERGRRAVLNLGHTVGHALERATGLAWRHGDAVSVGMIVATQLAARLGLCEPGLPGRLTALLGALGLPTQPPPVAVEAVWQAMAADKKRRGGELSFVLPVRLGHVVVQGGVAHADFCAAWKEVADDA